MDVDRIRQALLDLKAYGVGGHLCDYGINEQDVIDAIDHLRKAKDWQPIDNAPKGKPILVHYTNSYGHGRTVKAFYIERFTEEASSDSDNDEYNEADDAYYTLPGWYEMIDNWDDFSSVAINSDPTHWMPLPPPPSTPEKAE